MANASVQNYLITAIIIQVLNEPRMYEKGFQPSKVGNPVEHYGQNTERISGFSRHIFLSSLQYPITAGLVPNPCFAWRIGRLRALCLPDWSFRRGSGVRRK